jgi:hypothetical protein
MRGLGERQRKERLLTDSKIAGFLSICPFTYEQLWRVSRIQRKTLRNRLDYFTRSSIVIKHRYSIPNEYRYYGYMYDYSIPYRPPLFGGNYYLLNLFNSTHYIEQLSSYNDDNSSSKQQQQHYNHESVTANDDDKEEGFTQDFRVREYKERLLNFPLSVTREALPSYKQKGTPLTSEEEEKCRHAAHTAWENLIYINRLARELDILSVKKGKRPEYSIIKIKERRINDIIKIAEFFRKEGYTSNDVLIRCSCQHTMVPGYNYFNGDFSDFMTLPMMKYSQLYEVMANTGFLPPSGFQQ